MEFEQLSNDEIIFSYQMNPAFGREGEDGGFSFTLHKNGKLQYCTYVLFDNISLLELFKMDSEHVKTVYELIQSERETLEKIPGELDNGTKDGVINEFWFYGHEKISAYNIKETFIQKEMILNRDYYKIYKENMVYENEVLRIFKTLCGYLKKCNVKLKLDCCKILRDDFALKITW